MKLSTVLALRMSEYWPLDARGRSATCVIQRWATTGFGPVARAVAESPLGKPVAKRLVSWPWQTLGALGHHEAVLRR